MLPHLPFTTLFEALADRLKQKQNQRNPVYGGISELWTNETQLLFVCLSKMIETQFYEFLRTSAADCQVLQNYSPEEKPHADPYWGFTRNGNGTFTLVLRYSGGTDEHAVVEHKAEYVFSSFESAWVSDFITLFLGNPIETLKYFSQYSMLYSHTIKYNNGPITSQRN